MPTLEREGREGGCPCLDFGTCYGDKDSSKIPDFHIYRQKKKSNAGSLFSYVQYLREVLGQEVFTFCV